MTDDPSPSPTAVAGTGPALGRGPRILLALALPVITVVAIVVGAKIVGSDEPRAVGPLAVATVDQPGADSTACKDLLSAMPATLAGGERRTLQGQTTGVAAWGDPAIVLRCGLPTPQELTCSSSLQGVDTVDWLQLQAPGQTTYLAADRPARIALTLPDGTGTAAIQDVSRIIAGTMAEQAVCTDGKLTPTTDR